MLDAGSSGVSSKRAAPIALTDPDPWELRSCGELAYLCERGIPYESGIDAGSRRRISLAGRWLLLYDPEDRGVAERWFADHEDGTTVAGGENRWVGAEQTDLPVTLNTATSERLEYQGAVWFRRTITTAELDRLGDRFGGWLRLRLEGFLIRATVWANGEQVFSREGGYTDGFAQIPWPHADLAVVIRVDNRHHADSLPMRLGQHHTPGWHTYLGIHREPWLERVPRRWICKIDARAVGRGFQISALTEVREPGGLPSQEAPAEVLAAVLTGPGGDRTELSLALTATSGALACYQGTIEPAELVSWQPGASDCYTLTVELGGADAVATRVGWRTVAIDAERVLLNGSPIFLRGICKHEDHPELGAVNPPQLIAGDLDAVENLSANYVRTAHYPHAHDELAEARRRGLLLAEEIPFYQAGTGFVPWFSDKRPLREFPVRLFGVRQLRRPALRQNALRQLAEMIERDRNNPAVIIWGIANEAYTLSRRSVRIYRELAALAARLDPTRPTTLAELTYGKPWLDKRRKGSRAVQIISVNAYFGWYFGRAEQIEAHLAELHRRYPGKPIIISEFGAGARLGRRESDGEFLGPRIPPGRTFSEEYQRDLIAHYLTVAARLPYVVGTSPWVLADFYCTEFPTNPIPNFNLKGVLSADRHPKAAVAVISEIYRRIAGEREKETHGG